MICRWRSIYVFVLFFGGFFVFSFGVCEYGVGSFRLVVVGSFWEIFLVEKFLFLDSGMFKNRK